MALFANNTGDKALESSFFYDTVDLSIDTTVFMSPTIDTKTGIIFLKVVNSENLAKETSITLKGGEKKYTAILEYISSDDTSIKNQQDQNYYSNAPGIENLNYSEAITPQKKELGVFSDSITVTLPVNSVNVIRFVPAKK